MGDNKKLTTICQAVVTIDDDTSGERPDPVFDVPLESKSPSQPPAAIAVTAANASKHHRAVELEKTITSADRRLKMEAAARRSVALILMKHNDYVGARKKLLDARTSYPALEYIDDLIKVCDIVCTAESQGSGIDWCSVLGIKKRANESEIELKYTELIRNLESVKNKFPEIQSALGLIQKPYSVLSDRDKLSGFDCGRDASLVPCCSVKPLESDVADSESVNIFSGSIAQSSSGTTGIVSEGADESNQLCNLQEKPLKRVRCLSGDDCEVIAQTQSINEVKRKHCSQEAGSDTNKNKTPLSEVEGPLGRSFGSVLKAAIVHKEPSLEFDDFSDRKKSGVFEVGQFVAIYDQEKMPRLYARIDRIERHYKKETNSTENALYVRWLRPSPVNPDEKKWHEAGLPVSCGFFKLDRFGIAIGSRPVFSHLISSFHEYHYSNENFELYPREGEVWALYKEWKPFDWCSNPKSRKGCKFLLVEILSDYSKAAGVKVASIVKVAGYRTIFRRSGLSYQIAARNLFGFSHNIPVRSAGDMRGLFSGMVLDLDSLSIPEDAVVDTVAAEFGGGSGNQQISRYPPITSRLNPEIYSVNQVPVRVHRITVTGDLVALASSLPSGLST